MWHDEYNLGLLRDSTFYYLYKSGRGEGGRPLKELATEIEGRLDRKILEEHGGRWVYEALRRFLFLETLIPANTIVHQVLQGIVVSWFDQNASTGETRETHLLGRMQRLGWFDSLRSTSTPTHSHIASVLQTRDMALAAVQLFKAYFSALDEQFEQAAVALIGRKKCDGPTPTDHDRQGYVTYRYSVSMGNVAKTFTVFTPPSTEYPYCSFRNFYANEENGVTKQARGIAISLHSGIYCIGKINDGDAFETIVIPSAVKGARLLSGLVLTSSAQGLPLVSRIALEKTDAKHSDACPPQIIGRDDVSKVLAPNIVRRIRNYIDFYVPPVIQSSELQRAISSEEMVQLTNRYCDGKFTLHGKPFNPADHIFYPFNQALTALDRGDRK